MDRQQDATEEDTVCVGAQSILRLLGDLSEFKSEITWMDYGERDYRLASVCDALHQIIQQARPCGHAKPVAHESISDGQIDRLRKAINALYLEWIVERR